MPQAFRAAESQALHTTRIISTKRTKPPVTEFEIILYDRPHYIPNQTPPQPPITLVPPRDTDAFIVDKVVTPFDVPPEQEQTVQRVLNYVVGWPDLPYVRYLVPCSQVLDYVSPRALEEWEYVHVVRQRAQKEETELVRQRKGTKRSRENSSNILDAREEQQKPQRQSRRSPKANISAPSGRYRARGPHKRRNRSLLAKRVKNATEPSAMATDVSTASVIAAGEAVEPQHPPPAHIIAQSIPSFATGSQRIGLSLTRPFQRLAEIPPIELPNKGAESVATADIGTTTACSDAEDVDMANTNDGWLEEDELAITGNGVVREPTQRKIAGISSQDISQSARHISYRTLSHVPIQWEPRLTPIPLPKLPGMPSPQRQASGNSSAGAAMHVSQPWENGERPTDDNSAKPKDAESEDVYEVDRLEDDWISADDGNSKSQPTRLFLVRWKGDWPPDQNPTWEPQRTYPHAWSGNI